jgi:hypothetical protein
LHVPQDLRDSDTSFAMPEHSAFPHTVVSKEIRKLDMVAGIGTVTIAHFEFLDRLNIFERL